MDTSCFGIVVFPLFILASCTGYWMGMGKLVPKTCQLGPPEVGPHIFPFFLRRSGREAFLCVCILCSRLAHSNCPSSQWICDPVEMCGCIPPNTSYFIAPAYFVFVRGISPSKILRAPCSWVTTLAWRRGSRGVDRGGGYRCCWYPPHSTTITPKKLAASETGTHGPMARPQRPWPPCGGPSTRGGAGCGPRPRRGGDRLLLKVGFQKTRRDFQKKSAHRGFKKT